MTPLPNVYIARCDNCAHWSRRDAVYGSCKHLADIKAVKPTDSGEVLTRMTFICHSWFALNEQR